MSKYYGRRDAYACCYGLNVLLFFVIFLSVPPIGDIYSAFNHIRKEIIVMKIDSYWSASGYGEPDLRVEVRELDKKTKVMGDVSSADIEILSYIGIIKGKEGKELVAFHKINKGTLDSLHNTTVTINPSYVEKDKITGILGDFIENGCLFWTDVPGKPIWIAPDRHVFNQIGFNGGGRFASLDPGLARNLALETQMVNHEEALNLLLRQDGGFTKVFSISRGKYEYVSQLFFVDCIAAFVDVINDGLKESYAGRNWKWNITEWELTHYRLTVRIENPELAKYMRKKYDVDISPSIVFINSETGDSSLICNACLTVDGCDSVTKTVRKKHTSSRTYDMTEKFFDDCYCIPEILMEGIARLKRLKSIPVTRGEFEYQVNALGILDEEIGKRGGKKEIERLIAEEIKKSDYYDRTYYDVTRRILSIPGKVKKPWILAPLTGAVIREEGGITA